MRSLLLLFCLLGGATCQRVDEPAPPPALSPEPAPVATTGALATTSAATAPDPLAPTSAVPATASTPASAASEGVARPEAEAPDTGRCIEPLADPPPLVAEPATICPHDPLDKPPVLKHGTITVREAKGTPVISVEIANTPATEQRGLMYRTKLGREQGMIFVWPEEAPRTFWMHNTCVPLDMLFLAKDGTIVGLLEQVPTLNDRPRGVRCPAAYVLEVNAGWSRRHGVKPGMKLELAL